MSKEETLHEIGKSISRHRKTEQATGAYPYAIGRALCEIESTLYPERNGTGVYWLINSEHTERACRTDGTPVYKNTRMGGLLAKYRSGTHCYEQTTRTQGENLVRVDILNRATYTPTQSAAKEVMVDLTGEANTYRFQYLSDLIAEHDRLQEEIARLREKQEQQRLAAEKAEQEEALRLKGEEEEKEREIKALEEQIRQSGENIRQTQTWIRDGVTMRVQHILDEYQEEAKRSHLYDGTPIVIEGGPGTGKTTTMIQRLKFLISADALREHDAPLTAAQIAALTDSATRSQQWLFFSPTDKLLSFLKQAMIEEELTATEANTTTLEAFMTKMLMAYRLRMPDSDGPFKLYRQRDGEETLIDDAQKAIGDFSHFFVYRIRAILLKIAALHTAEYPWHDIAISIQAYCKRAESVKDLDALMNLFNSIQTNEKKQVKALEEQLDKEKRAIALEVKRCVTADEAASQRVYALFERWAEEAITERDDEADEYEFDETEDEEEESVSIDFEALLYKHLKALLRNIALHSISSKQKLTARQREFHALIAPHVEAQNLDRLAHLEWFKKNFAFLCRGIESNIFNQVPKLYKEFRREQAGLPASAYRQSLLSRIIKRDSGKRIHREELELIVGFINNMVRSVQRKSRQRFEAMRRNKYVRAYTENAKHVIGVDEATDYTLLDYYFITSFQHYDFSSLTLTGDIMQGLNSSGITDWAELHTLLPTLAVYELRESYRQLPTLLDMSKRLYLDERGTPAPYSTVRQKTAAEPAPICLVSDDMEEKAEWIAKRVVEIYKYYGGQMPSVAICVGDEVNIAALIDTMVDQDLLNGIPVLDGSDSKASNTTKCVRVFRLREVKGMEFEVVFFYDIDAALRGQTHEMMRRYLYVGVSRATSHLAATFTCEEGNEDIIKYFDRTRHNWRL